MSLPFEPLPSAESRHPAHTGRFRPHIVSRPSEPEDDGLVGQSPGLRTALERVLRVAPTDASVLITGETGTGKELVARAIHRRSRRASRPVVAVNLAAVPESLVASELFGHEAGAFTGALQRRIGRFELADHGTLMLDEIGELTPDVQTMLLRVLQEGEFSRLGASQTRQVDVRIIALTNRDLEAAMANGEFREDLFYRLCVFPIHLPPLRERREDIPAIAEHVLKGLSPRLHRCFDGIDHASLARMVEFSWPGNIRQLENVIEQSAILCDGPLLSVPPGLLVERSRDLHGSPLRASLADNERRMIEQVLEGSKGRVSGADGAAARLGVPVSTLESKIRRFRIDKQQFRSLQ